MEKFIPFRSGLEMGRGFDTLTGDLRGAVVQGQINVSKMSGQEVSSSVSVIESQSQLLKSLDISIEAGGRYLMSSAEGRFGLAEQSAFTSQSTYVVARCVVENAYQSYSRPQLYPEAAKRLRIDGADAFKESYGDGFVLGMRSGGELYVVFQLTSTSFEEQKELAGSVRAEVQALVAGGSLKTTVKTMEKSSSKASSISVIFYQRAGSGTTIAPVSNPQEIAKRLKEFPTIAKNNPVGYLAQVIDYKVLDLPAFDEIGFRQREEALEDYMRLKMKYLGMKAEYQLVRMNRDLFVDPPSSEDLVKFEDTITEVINYLNRHAKRVANREIEPDLFILKNYDKKLKLPVHLPFVKKAPESELIEVPNIEKMPVTEAKKALSRLGLSHESQSRAVESCKRVACNTVLKQNPPPGSMIPPKTPVRVEYNYLKAEKFPWFVTTDIGKQKAITSNLARMKK